EWRGKADYYEQAVSAARTREAASLRDPARQIAHWMVGDLARLLNASGTDIEGCKISPADLYAMIALVEEGTISGKIAKSVFEEMFRTGKAPATVVRDLGLEQMSSSDEITALVERVVPK